MALSFTKKLLTDNRGTAYVEALAAIPFFIIMWVGMLYLHQGYSAKQQATMLSRRCIWQYSDQGCSGGPPEGCEGILQVGAGLEERDGIVGTIGYGLEEVIGAIFGESLTALAKKELARPNMFGGDDISISGNQYFMCNEEPVTMESLVKKVACKMAGAFC